MTKKIWVWFVLTFIVSWTFFITWRMFGDNWQAISLLLAMLTPALMVFVVQLIFREPIKGKFYLKLRFNKFVILGVLTPLMLVFNILLINVLLTSADLVIHPEYIDQLAVTGVPEQYYLAIIIGSTLFNGILAGVTVNAIFAFGEELGWRGFLQKELGYLGSWKSSAIIGAVWGFWHAPLVVQGYNFPEHPYVGVVLMVIATTFLGIIISYLTKRSGTILTAAFFHGVFNAVARLLIILTGGYSAIWHGPFGVIAIVIYASVAGLLYLFEKRRQLKGQQRIEL